MPRPAAPRAGSGPVLGLVGCGRWGRNVLRDLLGLGARVVVADPDPEARARAEAAGAAGSVAAAEALPALDGYLVASPATHHAAAAETLLARGAPVFVEKPLTADPRSARRLAELGGGRLFVMDKWRHHPGVELLAALAQGGELGRVLGLETTRVQWGHAHRDVDGVWTLAPHDLSIALEVLGCVPEPRAAVAECTGGVPTHLVALLGEAPWQALQVSVRAPERLRRVRLRAESGVATLVDGAGPSEIAIQRDGGAPETRPFSDEPPLRAELRVFLAHLAGGPAPKSSAAEGARVVEVLARLRTLAGLDRGEPSGRGGSR